MAAGVAGILAAAVALGVAELVAAAVGPRSSPVIAVGAGFIDLTPRPLKEFAISAFGENDKNVLLGGVYATLVLVAIGIGLATLRRLRYGLLGIAGFGSIGVVAALTRPDATAADALPALLGAAAGAVALYYLARALPRPAAATGSGVAAEAGAEAGTEVGAGAGAGPGAGADASVPAEGPAALDRRRFLWAGGVSLAVAAFAGGVGRMLLQRLDVSAARAAIRLPEPAQPAPLLPAGVDLKLRNLTSFTTPNSDFYRVDTVLVLPQVSPDDWRLRIHGRVRNPMTLTFDDLLRRDLIEREITLTCVSNEVGGDLAGTARWLGAPLKALLDEVQPEPGADQIVTTSADGWTCGTPTEICRDGRDAMLAVAMNGEPLPIAHGFPVRMVVPGLYGYVSATKWVVDLELSSFGDFNAYWVRRGWSARAPIKTSSRIDTPRPFARPRTGVTTVAGVAWAQHRGIDKVEVRVDKGPWQTATLAAEASIDTWRQWTWQWRVDEPGAHTIECRATDRSGATQTEERQAPFPDGATGWHSVVVTVQ